MHTAVGRYHVYTTTKGGGSSFSCVAAAAAAVAAAANAVSLVGVPNPPRASSRYYHV